YTYDPVGNRTASLGVSSYTTNASNELTSDSDASYSYDYNGNTTSKTDSTGTTDYTWDYENRLASVTLPGTGGTVSLKYDPFGRRIEKISPTTTSIFAYDGDNLVETVNSSGGVIARYTQGENIDQPLAMLRSSTTSYYEQDGLNSVTSLSNISGALAQTYTFDSFGNQTASSGSLTNFFLYIGREFDTETGLYFDRARYLDPRTGRFLSEDPIRFSGGDGFYTYASNSPVSFLDPSGLLAELYCERISPMRGGSFLGDAMLFVSQAMHCYIHVKCAGIDETLELYGPSGPGDRTGHPHVNPFNPNRSGWLYSRREFNIYPPPGLNCCGFEQRLVDAYNRNSGMVPGYNPLGPNSNTFAHQIIIDAGGTADFPIGAYGVNTGLH
ncbi:MAG: RHS repeat-associated core domain-containing protein, partial [Candidatus Acidiferrales bacterium]